MDFRKQHSLTMARSVIYWLTGIVLTAGFLLGLETTWRSGAELHTVMETLSTFLAAIVGALVLVRFYSRKDHMFLYIGAGFMGAAFLDGYHTLVTSTYFRPMMPSDLPSLSAWSWIASRQFLSVLMFLSWIGWWREDRFGPEGRFSVGFVYISTALITSACFLFLALTPLPRAYFPEIPFHRPEEFGPAVFFFLAFVGFCLKGEWRHDSFDHWLLLSLIVGFFSQAVFMSHSGHLFDIEFDTAHVLKQFSYLCVLIGLAINVHKTFAAAQQNESRIKAVMDTAIDGFITIDVHGRITSVDPTAENTFGYLANELIGKKINMLMPPPFCDEYDALLERYLHTGEAKIIGAGREVIGKRRDGSLFPLEITIAELPATNDKRSFVCTVRDISERKIQERALSRSEQRFRDFADSASDWFWETDDTLHLSYLSGSFSEVSEGAQPDQYIGKTQQEIGWAESDQTKWLLHDKDLAARRPIKDFQYLFITPKGSERYWSISGRPVFDDKGGFQGYRGVGRDITEKKRIDQELEAYRDHLEALVAERTSEIERQAEELERALEQEQEHNTLQREFVAMVSHEFRTPLAIIDGAAQRIERRIEKLTPEDLAPRVTKIRSAVVRMTELIEGVLNIAKLDAGKIAMEGQSLDLVRLVIEVCRRQRDISRRHTISVDLSEVERSVWGDPKLLDQVFTNLVSNAIKYSPESSQIEITGKTEHGLTEISVHDHGVGIPDDEIPKLFERYFRASTSTGIAGTGIGLNLVKELIEMHDGAIKVESEKGQGSIFTVSLPTRKAFKPNVDRSTVRNGAAPPPPMSEEDGQVSTALRS